MVSSIAEMVGSGVTGFVREAALFSPVFGGVVLAAVIERPFYTAGGLRTHTIWYAIQANMVAMIAVVFVSMFQGLGGFFGGPLASLALVLASILFLGLVKFGYLYFATGGDGGPRLKWVLAAVAVSLLVYYVFMSLLLMFDKPWYRVAVQPYSESAAIILLLSCVTAIAGAFIIPLFAPKPGPPSDHAS